MSPQPINGVKESKMGFSLKMYQEMKQEFLEFMRTYLARHNVPVEEQLPAHRRPYVLFLKQVIKELDNLPAKKNPSPKELSEEERKALILSGVMLMIINQLDKNSLLRRSLIINMGVWGGDAKERIDPNSMMAPNTLIYMISKTMNFYNSLVFEKPYEQKILFVQGKSSRMLEDHPFSKLEFNLAAFEKTAVDLWANASRDLYRFTRETMQHEAEIKNSLGNEKKGRWYTSLWSSGKDKKEVREEPNLILPQFNR